MGWQFSVMAIVEDLRLGEPPGRVLTYRVVFLDEEAERRWFASERSRTCRSASPGNRIPGVRTTRC